MGNLLLTIASSGAGSRAGDLFRRGLACAKELKSQSPTQVLETPFANLAAFARQNGSGGSVARDEAAGDWLAASGSWFHTAGYASGEEAKLLAPAREAGLRRLAGELEGFFLLAYGNAAAREVAVITDLAGSRHGFIRDFGDCLAISTSSLLLASLGEAPLDPVGCEEFLRLGVIYEERTLFRDVRKLAPATIYRFVDGRQVESSRYWRLNDLDPHALDGDHAVEQLSERLIAAAKRISKLHPRPVCDLTAGYDSRAVVSAMMRAGVTFETTVSGPRDSPDVVIAERLARITHAPHSHVEPEARVTLSDLKGTLRLTDGEIDPIEYARIRAIHRHLAQAYDASINGSYGEIARGYWWELLRPRTGCRERVDPRLLAETRYAIGVGSSPLFPSGLDLTAHLAAIIGRCNRDQADWPNTAQMDNAYLTLRMQRWQGRIASSTDQIWPCLSIFLFRSVIETALQTAPHARQHSRLARRVMIALQPELAAHPLESGAPALPLTVATWPRFLPVLAHLAGKAGRKLFRRVAPVARLTDPARLRLCREDEVQALLDPSTMRLNKLIETERLRSFLDSSRAEAFAFDGQWRRLLGVELALRTLDALR